MQPPLSPFSPSHPLSHPLTQLCWLAPPIFPPPPLNSLSHLIYLIPSPLVPPHALHLKLVPSTISALHCDTSVCPSLYIISPLKPLSFLFHLSLPSTTPTANSSPYLKPSHQLPLCHLLSCRPAFFSSCFPSSNLLVLFSFTSPLSLLIPSPPLHLPFSVHLPHLLSTLVPSFSLIPTSYH